MNNNINNSNKNSNRYFLTPAPLRVMCVEFKDTGLLLLLNQSLFKQQLNTVQVALSLKEKLK